MYVLLLQPELLILALISHSKQKYIYASVYAGMLQKWMQKVKETAEEFKGFRRGLTEMEMVN